MTEIESLWHSSSLHYVWVSEVVPKHRVRYILFVRYVNVDVFDHKSILLLPTRGLHSAVPLLTQLPQENLSAA